MPCLKKPRNFVLVTSNRYESLADANNTSNSPVVGPLNSSAGEEHGGGRSRSRQKSSSSSGGSPTSRKNPPKFRGVGYRKVTGTENVKENHKPIGIRYGHGLTVEPRGKVVRPPFQVPLWSLDYIKSTEVVLPNVHDVRSGSTHPKEVESEASQDNGKNGHGEKHVVFKKDKEQYDLNAKREFYSMTKNVAYKKAISSNAWKVGYKNWSDTRIQKPPRFLRPLKEEAQKLDVKGNIVKGLTQAAAPPTRNAWNVVKDNAIGDGITQLEYNIFGRAGDGDEHYEGIPQTLPAWVPLYSPFIDYRERLFNITNFPGETDLDKLPTTLRQEDFCLASTKTDLPFEGSCSPQPAYVFDDEIRQNVLKEAYIAFHDRKKFTPTIASPPLTMTKMKNRKHQPSNINGASYEKELLTKGSWLPPSVARYQPPRLPVFNFNDLYSNYWNYDESGTSNNRHENIVGLSYGDGSSYYANENIWQTSPEDRAELPFSEFLTGDDKMNQDNYWETEQIIPAHVERRQRKILYYLVQRRIYDPERNVWSFILH